MSKSRFLNRIISAADLQEEHLSVLPLIEIAGDRRVLVEHHKGVSEYGENQIGILVKFGTVIVLGSGLRLSLMSKDRLIVSGCIDSIQLFRG